MPWWLSVSTVVFAGTVFILSWWHWWTFQYGTFDLAFYVQALWLAVHGHFNVSLLNVPLLGNHAEPLVFLIAPVFALCPHPMTLVAIQTVALATLPATAFRIGTKLDLGQQTSALLSLGILLTPATGFVGLHEFHPEAFSAPLFLLLIEARLSNRLGRFWLCVVALVSCKENIALLVLVYSTVQAIIDRKNARSSAWQLWWNVGPLLIAATWLTYYAKFLSPALNAGNVDYFALYSHLGSSGSEIVGDFFSQPQKVISSLVRALWGGNLVWALLIPYLCLPLLRPRWLLVAFPVLLQHLLSWRSSEWSVRFHYAAPFIPLFWIASIEVVQKFRSSQARLILAYSLLGACLIAQILIGPVRELATERFPSQQTFWARENQRKLLEAIPKDASVTASLPFLSHLAMRNQLFSLHHVIKGLKTLSRATYNPPASDFVLVDYADASTFSTFSGYYHPAMRTIFGQIIPSSDLLLHRFLIQSEKSQVCLNSVTLYFPTKNEQNRPSSQGNPQRIDDTTELVGIDLGQNLPRDQLCLRFTWRFARPRVRFPWLDLIVTGSDHHSWTLTKGVCAAACPDNTVQETWDIEVPPGLVDAKYRLTLRFTDHLWMTWPQPALTGSGIQQSPVLAEFDLGERWLGSAR